MLSKIPVTEGNVVEASDTLADITNSTNKAIDIEHITDALVNIVNVESPSPKVSMQYSNFAFIVLMMMQF